MFAFKKKIEFDINELKNSLNQKSKAAENKIDPFKKKFTGSYYTDIFITDIIINELIETIKVSKDKILSCKFLEPCVGAGNFVFSYILKVHEKYNLTREEAKIFINNIFVSDINSEALETYKTSLKDLVMLIWEINLEKKYFDIDKLISKKFSYSTVGILNLYKLFVEEIIERYSNENAYISLLIPSSIMTDKTCEKLRTHVFKRHNLLSVRMLKKAIYI